MRLRWMLLIPLTLPFANFGFHPPDSLKIYAVDVEGGKATLVVSPASESILIDTGNIGDGAPRDAARIMEAIKDAGVRRIDYLITTHWHRDHIGALPIIAQLIPVREFIDHGPSVQRDEKVDEFLRNYPLLYARSKHTVVKAGDKLAVAGLDVSIVASAGNTIRAALHHGSSPSASCSRFVAPENDDNNENSQSIGIRITFGRFRLVDLGDLSTTKEFTLMCPRNSLGTVDLFMVSHHGQPKSNSELLVHALQPRVAIMNNGSRKGGQPEVMQVLYSSPGLENLWQLHFSWLSGQEYGVPGLFIANRVDPPHATAFWIKVSAQKDGSFTVTNSRNGFSKSYGRPPTTQAP